MATVVDLRAATTRYLATGQQVASQVWGGTSFPLTQHHGVPGFRSDWYQYSAAHGWPAGYHLGVDVGMPRGTRIVSNTYGVVEQAGWSDSFRPNPVNVITADDPTTPRNEAGSKIIYGHLWEAAVRAGQRVKPGDILGYSGEQTVLGTMQADGSGPHIHYEVRMPSAQASSGEFAVNPLPFLSGDIPAGTALGGNPLVPSGAVGLDTGGVVETVTGAVAGYLVPPPLVARAGVFTIGLVLILVAGLALTKGGPLRYTPVGRVARALA